MFRNAIRNDSDPRVRRTRDRLGRAFGELLAQKAFDAITVQDVLDRAQVSRATFYRHYDDTDDLFLTVAETIFEEMATLLSRTGDQSERVVPVQEVFERFSPSGASCQAIIASGRSQDLLGLAQAHFARGIEQRLREMPRARTIRSQERSTLALALAGSLFALLTWWVQHGKPCPAEEMDLLFHRLVWAGIAPANNQQRR